MLKTRDCASDWNQQFQAAIVNSHPQLIVNFTVTCKPEPGSRVLRVMGMLG